jgi:hypothetical protein
MKLKKTLFLFMATFFTLIMVQPPAIAQVQKTSPKTRSTAASARRPEPSGVHGWVAIIDPRTGERWVPTSESAPGVLETRPGHLYIKFRKVGSPIDKAAQIHTVTIGNTGVGFHVDGNRKAWYYSISFSHETLLTGTPDTVNAYTPTVRYNPNLWTFYTVEFPYYDHSVLGDGITRVLWRVEFTRRVTPFPDLPDSM